MGEDPSDGDGEKPEVWAPLPSEGVGDDHSSEKSKEDRVGEPRENWEVQGGWKMVGVSWIYTRYRERVARYL